VRFLLAPLLLGLTVLDKVWGAVAGTPDIPPTPVVVLDTVGPWAGWDEAL